jgi:CheY-like chemotaxis protein
MSKLNVLVVDDARFIRDRVTSMVRDEGRFPTLLDQVVVDIEQLSGDAVARINGFVLSMQATEPRQDTPYVDVRVQFVDDDPDKMAHLSKYIASVR